MPGLMYRQRSRNLPHKSTAEKSSPCFTKLEIPRRVSGFAIWAAAAWIIIKLDTDVLWNEMAFNARLDGSRLIKKKYLMLSLL